MLAVQDRVITWLIIAAGSALTGCGEARTCCAGLGVVQRPVVRPGSGAEVLGGSSGGLVCVTGSAMPGALGDQCREPGAIDIIDRHRAHPRALQSRHARTVMPPVDVPMGYAPHASDARLIMDESGVRAAGAGRDAPLSPAWGILAIAGPPPAHC